ADQIAFVKIHFVFDNSWKLLHKVVQFSQDEFTYNRVLGFDDTSCLLPAELTPGAVKMSLFGYDAAATETVRATTVVKTLNIRPSGFDGENSNVPPTPDLYQQLLAQIGEASKGADGKSAFEIAVENGFVGTKTEWLESLKGHDGQPGKDGVNGKDGADGRDGKDGITPDMSDYPNTSAVELMIQKLLYPVSAQSHEHGNKEVLDAITSELLSQLTALEQFENSINSELQAVKESVEPVISQAHWHHNLTLLNAITSARMQKWDEIDTIKENVQSIDSDLQQLDDSMRYELQVKEDEILALENRIIVLESKITGSDITLFAAGNDVFDIYDTDILLMYNNGIYTLIKFVEQYPLFCHGDDGYVLNYSYDALGWGAEVMTASSIAVSISGSCKIIMEYSSGAKQTGRMYLVSNSGRDPLTPIARFIFDKISSNDCIEVPFEWLYSDSYIATVTSCSDIPAGEYYLAWTGISDNTHPKIKSVKIRKG
ncbi:MAG: hypothetical protein ACI4J2_04530, partial [Ruminococcus sp.]